VPITRNIEEHIVILKRANNPYLFTANVSDYGNGIVLPIERVVKDREYPHEKMWIANLKIVPHSIQDSKQNVQT
jgi:hypothetical protein